MDGESSQGKVFKATDVSVLGDLGLVIGRAIVCTEKNAQGEWADHYDLQGDHIPKLVAIKGLVDFAENCRTHKVMHQGEPAGEISMMLPITTETCAALKINADWEGVAVCFRPEPTILAKFQSGEFRGFSIGGGCNYDLEEAA